MSLAPGTDLSTDPPERAARHESAGTDPPGTNLPARIYPVRT